MITPTTSAERLKGQHILGDGAHQYEVVENWAQLPDGWFLKDVAAIGVDGRDNVYVFNRSDHPMMVFDRNGSFLRSWGESVFSNPHGLDVGPDGALYCTDDGDHTVRKCSPDGKILLEIGVANRPTTYMSGWPFNRCTHTALAPNGDIYVSDGYGNACVHAYSPDGRLKFSWGRPGTAPGQFNIPHNICCCEDGFVYIADRENHRIQVFDGAGRYQTQWNNLHRPCALCLDRRTSTFFAGELAPQLPINRDVPNLGPRISILDRHGRITAQLGDERAGSGPTQFVSPHGIAIDSHGDLYVGEISHGIWPRLFPDTPRPAGLPSLRKLRRVKST